MTDKTDYTKKPLSLAEQVARLKQRGLVFDDENEAISYLFNISYYRLRAYTYPEPLVPILEVGQPQRVHYRTIRFEESSYIGELVARYFQSPQLLRSPQPSVESPFYG